MSWLENVGLQALRREAKKGLRRLSVDIRTAVATEAASVREHITEETEKVMTALAAVQQSYQDFAFQIEQVRAALDETIAGLTAENEELRGQLQASSDELATIRDTAQAKSAELQADDPVEEPPVETTTTTVVEEPVEPEPEPEV